jgi:hypothetical protein
MRSAIWVSVVAVLAYAGVIRAAQMTEEARSVWSVVEQSWVDETAENGKWPADYVHADVVAWGKTWPSPRRKESLVKWVRFEADSSKTLEYEIFPVEVVVHGDTAVALYNAVVVVENAEGKRQRRAQGLVETLVRDGQSWKFLALTSFTHSTE